MATPTLDVELRLDPGGVVFHRRFTRFISDLTDLTPAFEQMADEFNQWEEEAFATGGASSGNAWPPLAASTAAHKTRRRGGQILVESGRLMRSLTTPNAQDAIRDITGRKMTLGTDTPYAGFHQTGTSRMPARPIIRLTAANRDRWTRIIHHHLVAQATGRLTGRLP